MRVVCRDACVGVYVVVAQITLRSFYFPFVLFEMQ